MEFAVLLLVLAFGQMGDRDNPPPAAEGDQVNIYVERVYRKH